MATNKSNYIVLCQYHLGSKHNHVYFQKKDRGENQNQTEAW